MYRGGSLKLWRDYFPHGIVVGIDRKLPQDFQLGERIQIFEGSQADEGFLSKVANATAPDGFDIIIDDASQYRRTDQNDILASVRSSSEAGWTVCD